MAQKQTKLNLGFKIEHIPKNTVLNLEKKPNKIRYKDALEKYKKNQVVFQLRNLKSSKKVLPIFCDEIISDEFYISLYREGRLVTMIEYGTISKIRFEKDQFISFMVFIPIR